MWTMNVSEVVGESVRSVNKHYEEGVNIGSEESREGVIRRNVRIQLIRQGILLVHKKVNKRKRRDRVTEQKSRLVNNAHKKSLEFIRIDGD